MVPLSLTTLWIEIKACQVGWELEIKVRLLWGLWTRPDVKQRLGMGAERLAAEQNYREAVEDRFVLAYGLGNLKARRQE